VVDSLGAASGWSTAGNPDFVVQAAANQAPTAASANQYRTDTGAAIALNGGIVPVGVGVNFKANVSDANGDTVRFEVELRQLPGTFTGVATHSSSLVSSGTQAVTATATGLAAGNYGWKFRVVDSLGAASGWSTAGNPDFIVQAAASGNGFYLGFPLSGYDAYTVPVSSVFDHSMTYRYRQDKPYRFVTFNGEVGDQIDQVESNYKLPYSFKKPVGTPANQQAFLAGVINYLGTNLSGPSTINYDGHPGYDFPIAINTSVFASADGWVETANTVSSDPAGMYIRLQHDSAGYQTQYQHLSQVLVTPGVNVTRGQLIGKSGNTGNSTGAHLHFEVKKHISGTTWVAVDPYGWTGSGVDPYVANGNPASVNLWQVQTQQILPPMISSIVPAILTSSSNNQLIKVMGSNFQPPPSSSHLIFTDPSGHIYPSSVHPPREGPITATEFDYQFNDGGTPGTWTVSFQNPDGAQSNVLSFEVMPTIPPVAATLLGLDVSHYQGSISWTKVRGAGRVFAFVKATNDDTGAYDDPLFVQNMTDGKAAGLVMGAYHLAQLPLAGAVAEANHFLSIAGPYITPGYLRPVLDVETATAEGFGEPAMSNWIRDWCSTVENATGIRPILYTTRAPARLMAADLNKYPLWISTFSNDPSADPGNIAPWTSWAFQQYGSETTQSTSPGIIGYVDLDSYNGDMASLVTNFVISAAKLNQTITFSTYPSSLTVGGPTGTLGATASSGLLVSFTASPLSVCTVSGTTVYAVSSGVCTITANQFGNASYNAAVQVTQSFSIAFVPPGTPTLSAAAGGYGSATLGFTPAVSGGQATTYTASCAALGQITQTKAGKSIPITVQGLTAGMMYSCSVIASNSAGTSIASNALAVTPLASVTSVRNALFVNASTSTNKTSVLRLINRDTHSGGLTATAYDEIGNVLGTAGADLGTLVAQQMSTFTSAQLEAAIGFTPSTPTAKYRVVFTANLPSFDVINFVKDIATGNLTLGQAQTDKQVPSAGSSSIRDALFISASTSANKTSVVRLINLGAAPGTVTATAYSETGIVVGTANTPLGTLGAQQMLTFTSGQLESALGYVAATPTAKYSIVFTATLPSFEVINFVKDIATGNLTLAQAQTYDRGTSSATSTTRNALVIGASSSPNTTSVVRLINIYSQSGNVTATAYNETGNTVGTVGATLGTLAAEQMLSFTSTQFENAIGYAPSTPSAKYRVVFTVNLPGFELINFVKDVPTGNLVLAHAQIDDCAASVASSSSRNVLFVNSSTSTNKTSIVRLINLAGQSGALTATAYDETGNPVGTSNAPLGAFSAQQMLTFTSAQLEEGIGYAPSSATAKYRIVFSASLPSFEVINYVSDVATGKVTLGQAQVD
jgi:murein DD-endopeptidase MepM/ murein hydrolase activator NlpD/GH25 family lysozyme M1 (1,4-beta-N-acetylmuramidase)